MKFLKTNDTNPTLTFKIQFLSFVYLLKQEMELRPTTNPEVNKVFGRNVYYLWVRVTDSEVDW